MSATFEDDFVPVRVLQECDEPVIVLSFAQAHALLSHPNTLTYFNVDRRVTPGWTPSLDDVAQLLQFRTSIVVESAIAMQGRS